MLFGVNSTPSVKPNTTISQTIGSNHTLTPFLFIGYVSVINEILKLQIDENDPFTKIFLDDSLREKFNVKLDEKSDIFHIIQGE